MWCVIFFYSLPCAWPGCCQEWAVVSCEIGIDVLQRALNTQVYEYAWLIVDKSACLNKKRHNNSCFSNTLLLDHEYVCECVCFGRINLLTTLSKMKFVWQVNLFLRCINDNLEYSRGWHVQNVLLPFTYLDKLEVWLNFLVFNITFRLA